MLPFEGGVEGRENATLIFAFAAALLYAVMLDAPRRPLRSAVKTLAVALLAVLAAMREAPLLLVAALALSALGDLFLSRDGEKAFLAGLASFLVAHLVYVALFVILGDTSLLTGVPWRSALAVAMAVFAIGMLTLLMRRVGPELRLPISAYVAAILAMGVSALAMPGLGVPLGALAFMASDALLASERFLLPALSPYRAVVRYSVWALYFAAQATITLSFVTL